MDDTKACLTALKEPCDYYTDGQYHGVIWSLVINTKGESLIAHLPVVSLSNDWSTLFKLITTQFFSLAISISLSLKFYFVETVFGKTIRLLFLSFLVLVRASLVRKP